MSNSAWLPRHPAAEQSFADAELNDRVILVVGAAGGLGSAVCRCIAARGATVVLLGRKVSPLEKVYDELVAAGAPTPAIYPLNLEGATAQDYVELGATLLREFGRVDGIVHAAVRMDALTPLEHLSAGEFLRSMQINLNAPQLLTRGCLEALRAAPDAAVVMLLDDPARYMRAYWGAYAVAKGGLEALLMVMADEFDQGSPRMHGLQPGPMRTSLRTRIWAAEDPASIATPERAARAVAWLLGAEGAALRGKVLDLELSGTSQT